MLCLFNRQDIFNRAAGVGLSKAVWCPVSVLCSNVELVILPGHFFNRAAGVGLSKAV